MSNVFLLCISFKNSPNIAKTTVIAQHCLEVLSEIHCLYIKLLFVLKICLPLLFIPYKNTCIHKSQLENVLRVATLFKNSVYAAFRYIHHILRSYFLFACWCPGEFLKKEYIKLLLHSSSSYNYELAATWSVNTKFLLTKLLEHKERSLSCFVPIRTCDYID